MSKVLVVIEKDSYELEGVNRILVEDDIVYYLDEEGEIVAAFNKSKFICSYLQRGEE